MELSLACTLTDTDLGERRRTILDSVRRAVLDVSPLLSGYAYRFEPMSENLSQLARIVDLERQCCAILTFRITVGAGQQPILSGNHRAARREGGHCGFLRVVSAPWLGVVA